MSESKQQKDDEQQEEFKRTICLHCNLRIPLGIQRQGGVFCCNGCETVYYLLRSCSLEDVYAEASAGLDRSEGLIASYLSFDDPTFLALYAPEHEDGTRQMELYLGEVHCAACVWLLEKLPSMVSGVIDATVHFPKRKLTLRWEAEGVKLSKVAIVIDRFGYTPKPYRGLSQEKEQEKEQRSLLIRIGVAGACAGNVMLIAFALYGGLFGGMERSFWQFFRWTSLLITIPSVFWAGRTFFQGAWSALRMRTLHMDLPIALGLGAGFASGTYHTIIGSGEIYFDTVTSLIFLLLIGRWLRLKQQHRASQATELLYSLTPASAHRIIDGVRLDIPIEALNAGDFVEVFAGERIPADGLTLEGSTQIDTSILTGESKPISVVQGSSVYTGTVNLGSRIVIEIEKAGIDTRVAQIMRRVEEASQQRAPIVRLVDRVAVFFILAVLALALFTLILWSFLSPAHALDHTIALLIISCPCALSLATPLAISAGIGKAAQHGLLIKGSEVLELLAKPGELWLDKTGTLTTGMLSLRFWYGEREWIPWVKVLEEHSSHPIAQAIVRALNEEAQNSENASLHLTEAESEFEGFTFQQNDAEKSQMVPPFDEQQLSDVRQILGGGLEARINGFWLRIGSPGFILEKLAKEEIGSSFLTEKLQEILREGCTPVLVSYDQRWVGILGLGDRLRQDAYQTVQSLKLKGWRVGILSGDHPEVVESVATQLDLDLSDCFGGMTPESKQTWIEQRKGQNTIVMVGDGVNDTAAFASADVGIAVHGGAEASFAVADAYLSRPGLRPLHSLLCGAERTFSVIKRNLFFSLSYNVIGATLAIMGLLHPLWAAILMPISSLTVISSSFRSKTFVAREPEFPMKRDEPVS